MEREVTIGEEKFMEREVTLGEVLKNVSKFEISEELFLLVEDSWREDTKGIMLDLDGVDDETEVMDYAKEKNMVHTFGITTIEEIVLNAHSQKTDYTLDELVSAFIFYFNNDAFIDFGEDI